MRMTFSLPIRRNPSLPPADTGKEGGFGAWVRLRSSTVGGARYHEGDTLLEIQFLSGATYRYEHVPQHVFSDLLRASSPGRFVHQTIKPVYQTRRVS